MLNREQIPTATGLVGRWSVVVIASILRNPVYTGRVRSRGREYAGEHEAILPDGTFEAAQALIARRADMAPRI